MKAVIFDLDGTLADTSLDLLASANACFRAMGHGDVLEAPRDAGVALRGGKMMLRTGLQRLEIADPEPIVEQYYAHLLEAYGAAISARTYMYPGAMAAVEQLKRDGYAVGICTNKPEALARQLLNDLGVLDAFAALVGADTLPVRKPNPEPLFETAKRCGVAPSDCLLVGDSDTDRNTSRAAGVASILVTFGPSGEDMAALEPEALLQDYADLPDLVQRLLG